VSSNHMQEALLLQNEAMCHPTICRKQLLLQNMVQIQTWWWYKNHERKMWHS
jgi:hypothetical protein